MTKPKIKATQNPKPKSTPKRKIVRTVNVMSRYTREYKCPYCGTRCKFEFEKDDPMTAVVELTKCEHLTQYDKYHYFFERDGNGGWD